LKAAALAQHKASKQAEANNLLNERVAEANAHHPQVVKDYKNRTSQHRRQQADPQRMEAGLR